MEEAFYNISMHLWKKNSLILEYSKIARSGPKSMIRNIEGNSKSIIQYYPPKVPTFVKIKELNLIYTIIFFS